MTPDAELSLTQVQIMSDIANKLPTFMITLPNAAIDSDEALRNLVVVNSEVDQLVDLKFMEDVSQFSGDLLSGIEKSTQHKHRIFHVTELGLMFFWVPRNEDGSLKPVLVN
jgi:hypothetical protein